MQTREKENTYSTEKIIYFIIIALLFIYESIILICLLGDIITFKIFVLLHLLACLLTVTILLITSFKKYDTRVLFLLFVTTAILGLLGPVLIMIIVLFNKYVLKGSKETIENILDILNENYYSETESLYNRLKYIKDSNSIYTNSEPFIDIMNYGTFYEKQQVLIMIRRHFQPKFASILFRSLKNKDNSIRVQAASLMASLEKLASEKYKALEEKLNGKYDTLTLAAKYLEFYEYYIETGIAVNAEYSHNFFDKILNILNTNNDSEDLTKKNILIAKILFKMKKFFKVVSILKNIDYTQCFVKDEQIILSFMECLYRTNQFQELRSFSKQLLLNNNIKYSDGSIMPILKFWTNSQ